MTQRILAFISATVLLASGMASAAPPARNLIVNGGFEANAAEWQPASVPKPWSTWQPKTLRPEELAPDRAVRHSGGVSARFTDATHGLTQHVLVKPGEVYNFRCRIKTNLTKGGAGLQIHWLDGQGKWVFNRETGKQVTHNCNLYGISEWREARLDNIRVPEGAARTLVSVTPLFGPKGVFWADDITMELAPSAADGEAYRATVRAPRITESPTVDGALDEPMWARAARIGNFTIPKLKALARQQTSAAMAYDKDALYLGVRVLCSDPDAMVARVTEHDGPVTGEDAIEIFLNSGEPGVAQMHFAFNMKAARLDLKEVWNAATGGVAMDSSWNPGWQVATRKGADAWTAEVRMPFAALGLTAPAVDATWGFNMTRHRVSGGEEFSSWSPLDVRAFQNPKEFGRVVFGDGAAIVSDAVFSTKEVGVEIVNLDARPLTGVARVHRPDGQTCWEVASREIALSASERRQVALSAKADDAGFLWLTVAAGGKILLREGCIPATEFAALGWYDPDDVLGNKLYVANDLRTYKPFQTSHNFEGGQAGPRMVTREQRAVDLVVELPEGVRATHVVQFINNWRWWAPVAPADVRPIMRGGETFSRFRFEIPAIFNYVQNETMVFFETSLPAGARANGRCYLEWDTGRQPPQPLEIEVITIGRVKPFERLFNCVYYAEAELLLTWFPELGRDYPRIGLNTLQIDPDPAAGGAQTVSKGASRRQWFDSLVKQGHAGGLYMTTSPSQSTPWFQNWTRRDADARAVAYDGKPVMDERWSGCYSPCPLYRGGMFQQHLDKLRNGPAFNEYRLSWLAIDLELWSDKAWNAGCFCPRCVEAYRRFMGKAHPKSEPGDPRGFMADPAAHVEQARLWREFREWSKRDFIQAFRTPLEARVARHGGSTGPRPGLLVSEWCRPEKQLFDVVDYFEINCYRKPVEVARRLGEAVKTSQGRKNVVAACSPGQSHSLDAGITAKDILYSVYECAAAGVQGMVWYDAHAIDALKLQSMVAGFRAIRPFEDIILNGSCRLELPCEGSGASARGMVLGAEALAVVRAYEHDEAITVETDRALYGTIVRL